jgi:tetratricopeptide (TPR) repeat protein
VSSYERAAKADPKFAKPHYKIGLIYERAKSFDLAIESLKKAIEIDPEYAPAYKDLGEIYYTQSDAPKAVTAYEKYLTITENPGQAKFQLAFFYFMAKDFEKANAIFKEVTNNPNASPVALKYYAYSLVEQNKMEEARPIFEKYFQKAKPEDITASDYAYYGKLLLKLDADSLATEAFTKSLALDSTQTPILQLQADTYFKLKKLPETIKAFKALMAARKTPMSADLFYIGRAYYMNEQYMEADTAFTKLAERQPNIPTGYLWAGRSRQFIDSTGTQGLAKPMYEQVIEKASTAPDKYKKDLIEAYDYLGTYTLQISKDVPKAKSYFEKILAIDPNYERAREFMKQLNAPAPKGK